MNLKIAAVDLGTNTLRLIVARWSNGVLEPILVRRAIVRLGEGLRRNGVPSSGAMERTETALREFGDLIRESGARRVFAAGTSAVRDLGAAPELYRRLTTALGFPLHAISGDHEANLMARGVQAGIGPVQDGLILDIGGGSTEMVRVRSGMMEWHRSLPEGVVHLTEEFLGIDPPPPDQTSALRERFGSLLEGMGEAGRTLVATAGTPTTLAALDLGIDDYDPGLVNGHVLSQERIARMCDRLLSMPAAARLRLPGMERGREDLIAAGVLIVREVMDRWGFSEMVVSDWGLLEGLAIEAAESTSWVEVMEPLKG